MSHIPQQYRSCASRCARAVAVFWDRIGDHLQEVVSGAATAIGVKSLTAALQLVLSVALARTLGAEGTGVFFLVFTVTWVMAVIARLGLDNVVLRQVALNASRMRWNYVKGIARESMAVVLSSSTICGVAVFLAAPWLARELFDAPDIVPALRWTAVAIPLLASLLLTAEMLKGIRKILRSQLVQGSLVPGFTAAGVLVLGPVFGNIGAVWAFVGATAITAVLAFVFWSRATPMLRGASLEFPLRSMFRSSMPLYWYSLMFMTVNWSSFLIVGMYGNNEEVGIFGVAWRISMLISFLMQAVESAAAPKFAILHDQGDLGTLRTVYQHITLALIVAALPILMVVLLFSQEIMTIFGHEFRGGSHILAAITVGRFGALVTGPVTTLLVMTGHERPARNIITLSAAFLLIASFSLAPLLGALGVAIAVGSALTLNSILGTILLRNYLGFWVFPSANLLIRGKSR